MLLLILLEAGTSKHEISFNTSMLLLIKITTNKQLSLFSFNTSMLLLIYIRDLKEDVELSFNTSMLLLILCPKAFFSSSLSPILSKTLLLLSFFPTSQPIFLFYPKILKFSSVFFLFTSFHLVILYNQIFSRIIIRCS